MSSVTMYEMKQTEEQKKNATIWNRAYKQGQKDLMDQMLEIIDEYKYSVSWASTQRRWAMMDEFRERVLVLKGEQG